MVTLRKPSFHRNIDLGQKDYEDTKNEPRKQPKQNFREGELEVLRQLEKRQDKVITNANKEVAVVIIDTVKYIAEAD